MSSTNKRKLLSILVSQFSSRITSGYQHISLIYLQPRTLPYRLEWNSIEKAVPHRERSRLFILFLCSFHNALRLRFLFNISSISAPGLPLGLLYFTYIPPIRPSGLSSFKARFLMRHTGLPTYKDLFEQECELTHYYSVISISPTYLPHQPPSGLF